MALKLLLCPLVSIDKALDVDLANAGQLAFQHLVETVVVRAALVVVVDVVVATHIVILHRVVLLMPLRLHCHC